MRRLSYEGRPELEGWRDWGGHHGRQREKRAATYGQALEGVVR